MNDSLVIIPTYNERENVVRMLDTVMHLEFPFDVLVVDDGSPDGTAALVKECQAKHPERIHLLERKGKLGLGTANLVNAMLHLGTPRLIHVSSVAALGRKAGQPTDESTLFEEQPGTSAYARSKHRAEMEAYRGAVEGLPEGLVVVNPTVILGAGDFKRSSSALFKAIDRGLSWYPIGSGGYVGAEDVAEVCVRLGESTVRDARFVLCAEHRTHLDVMGSIADALGKPRPKRPVQPWIAGLAWRLVWLYERLTGRRSMVTRESVAS